jgi:hypothetical protein
MLPLDKAYLNRADDIAKMIQESDELANYLSEEDEAIYEQMKEQYEPLISELHERVSKDNPLQIISLEQRLMQEDFEGLFLPRMLGYSALRGELNDQIKYTRPQDHFKDLLLAICNSPNFEVLKKRIGQTIQIGFALSSDIWITNIIAAIENKRIRYFLQSQKLDKYRDKEGRAAGLKIYKKQFQHFIYMTADFPKTFGELKVLWSSLKEFLIYRVEKRLDNSTLLPFMKQFVENPDFKGHDEHLQILCLYANFFDLDENDNGHLYQHLNDTRRKHPNFKDVWFDITLELLESNRVDVDAYADARIYNVLDREINDDVVAYYDLVATIHSSGYFSEEAMDAVKSFYNQHEGRSVVNECVRLCVYKYFARLLNNLEIRDYHELFNLSKVYTVYIRIFGNQQFNLNVKELCMKFVNKALKHYTDKRGKDYQDIKKFVSTSFQDLNFLKEKDVVEMFKTRRKKRATPSK